MGKNSSSYQKLTTKYSLGAKQRKKIRFVPNLSLNFESVHEEKKTIIEWQFAILFFNVRSPRQAARPKEKSYLAPAEAKLLGEVERIFLLLEQKLLKFH
mgnify:CR=1 FL=1